MLRFLVIIAPALAACAPAPQKEVMQNSTDIPVDASNSSSESSLAGNVPDNPALSTRVAPDAPQDRPITSRHSAAASVHPDSSVTADTPAGAEGRRIVSTAFVRLGPGEYLTVELRGGQAVVLRDVTMRAKDFCGVRIAGAQGEIKYCGQYGEVVAARPGGGPAHGGSPDDPAGVPLDPGQGRP